MAPLPLTRILPPSFLAHLLLFSLISLSVCVEFTEETGKLGKINLLQRGGNQWAIGHFMGKKSLQDSYSFSDQGLEESAIFPPRNVDSMRTALLQEQRRAQSSSQLQGPQRILRKILEQYFKNYQK
ncbi:Bombesin precursor [Pelobates cultripes]|uniref:Bombesin n=1 Tax=Pelobates cultripes TaxID=61616 RepID=A0AAD1RL24_PELCU|nr:Bombesin precursor [Pelobates cultripes]